jgi:hypothetical protein
MTRRLLVYGLWALVAPAVIGAYAFTGAWVTWTAGAGVRKAPAPWAFALSGPAAAGITSAVALVSYSVGHDHAGSARRAIADGNRLIADVPTGYRLGRSIAPHRIAVREHDGIFFVCARSDTSRSRLRSQRPAVECAAGPLPLRVSEVVWTSGRSLTAATRTAGYRRARAAGGAAASPSTRTVAALAVGWLGRLGHGRSGTGFAFVLAAALLAVAALALHSPGRRRGRRVWRGASAGAAALAVLDVGARLVCGPSSPRAALDAGIVDVWIGGAVQHRHVSMWGDEGPVVELLVVLAVACAGVVAVRRSNRMLMFAAALTLLGTVTNLAEVALRTYDTDYLWFGNGVLMSPFNLGDVYELGGGVVMAYYCLRTIATGPRLGASPAAGDVRR